MNGKILDNSGGIYVVNCATARSLQPLTFTLGSEKVTLTWDQQIIVDLVAKQCISIFQPIDASSGVGAIIGATFLSNFFTVFDRANYRVGLATPTGKVTLTLPAASASVLSGPSMLIMVALVAGLCL
jgi:Eukaryotic aspartyl protease